MLVKADFNAPKAISPKFYGIFFEDINFSIDGGINNNQIVNKNCAAHNVDYVRDFHYFYYQVFHARRRYMTRKITETPLKFWSLSGEGSIAVDNKTPVAPRNPKYMTLSVSGTAELRNKGYNGGDSNERRGRYLRRNSSKCGIGVHDGGEYDVKVMIKNVDYKGDVVFYVEDEKGAPLTESARISLDGSATKWVTVQTKCKALKTGIGTFVARFEGKGNLNATEWYFGNSDYWGKGDPKWTGGRMRRDLVEALRDLRPRFIRFPGGCLVEGYSLDNSFDWKVTVGKVEERGTKFNLWGEAQKDRTYMQTNEIGFYEYFLLCEDLGAEPLPILNAGLACQGRTTEAVEDGDEEFERRKQNILDLIEYANGDPEVSEWARLRAEQGHPAPFNLKMIGIGNENFGELYNRNFDIMANAVKEKYPDVDIIWSAGFDCYKHERYESHRALFDGKHPTAIVDDHFYRTPQWTIEHADLYDDYDRSRNRIFLGEYAANTPWNGRVLWNNYYSALAEAAFLTGLERNGDIVVMSSYAPLFSRVGGEQWKHNMINFNSLYTLKTANYFVQQMYSVATGDKYIPVDSCVRDGVYTSVTADDEYAYVKAVNLNRVEMKYSLEAIGVTLGEKCTVTTLAHDDDEGRNELDYSGKPVYNIAPLTTTVGAEGGIDIELPACSVNVIKIKIDKE